MKRRGKQAPPPKMRDIELRIMSAHDLENVKRIGKMRCYAVAYIDPEHKASTKVDEEGEGNPVWNEKLILRADEHRLVQVLSAITVDIYAQGHLRDKPVGSARVLISEVLKGGDPSNPSDNPVQCIALQVWKPCGRPHGILKIWIPPTGHFLLRRLSLCWSRKETHNGAETEMEASSTTIEDRTSSPTKAE